MKKKTVVNIIAIVAMLALVVVCAFVFKTGTLTSCLKCEGAGKITNADSGEEADCEDCGGVGNYYVSECPMCHGSGEYSGAECDTCAGAGEIKSHSNYYANFIGLIPPIVAIVLALITKEVYSSLFVGIAVGALFYTNFRPVAALDSLMNDGLIGSLADAGNVGILVFLVLLGIMVALVNKAGGSKAFGEWAKTHVKTRVGAQLSTFFLGVLIFIDDYFNCLTVGSVMTPLSDSHRISRAKLAYIIDATAAPICMIAPISSWAAAVSGVVEGQNGLALFIKAIPYNFYSLLTIVMIITISLTKFDYGPMKRHEINAQNGDLFSEGERNNEKLEIGETGKGKVIDLILPVVVLIVCCVIGMIYTGGFFSGENFIDAFANCDATVGLPWGALIAVIFSVIYFLLRGKVSFTDTMACIPKGFIAMVSPILILTLAWSLNGMTGMLGSKFYVAGIINGAATGLASLLPAIIFLVACGLSFSTGTSWGTFGILLPIVVTAFGASGGNILILAISACLAGAVCGDHCSPISDTTIMASAGAQCNHINHVSTQLPYALTVAAVSFVSYIIAGFVREWYLALPISIVLMLATLFVIKKITSKQTV